MTIGLSSSTGKRVEREKNKIYIMWKKTEKAVKNPFGNIIIGTGDNPASDGREHNIIVPSSLSLSQCA